MLNNYSTVIGSYKGNSILEILENGRPIGEQYFGLKDHFAFGKIKARLIFSLMDIIKEFSDSDGQLPVDGSELSFKNKELGLDCVVARYSSFRCSSGRLVDRPYLEIRDQSQTKIKFGRKIAQAIIDTEIEIRQFALS